MGIETSFEIQIPNYQRWVQDVTDYYNRWQSVLTSTQTVTEDEMPRVNLASASRIGSFLKSISQTPLEPSEDLHIVLRASDARDLTIGSLSPEQFAQVFNAFTIDLATEMFPQTLPVIPIP